MNGALQGLGVGYGTHRHGALTLNVLQVHHHWQSPLGPFLMCHCKGEAAQVAQQLCALAPIVVVGQLCQKVKDSLLSEPQVLRHGVFRQPLLLAL